VHGPGGIQCRKLGAYREQYAARQRLRLNGVQVEQAGAEPILQVMTVIGDVVGNRGDLRLQGRERVEFQIQSRLDGSYCSGQVIPSSVDTALLSVENGTIVLRQPFQHFKGEVKPVKARIAAFKLGDHPQALGVVIEAAICGERPIEGALTGMAERRMAQIVGERQRLGQILVESERPRDRSGYLRNLKAMRQASAEMITLVLDEDLGLVLEATERLAVDDAVAVTLKGRTEGVLRLTVQPPARCARIDCIARAPALSTTEAVKRQVRQARLLRD
jgi:hypothetical protein